MTKLIPPVVDRGAMAGMEQPVISVDDEVSLRPFRPNDARAVVQAFSTPDIQHYHFRRVDSDAEAMQWILVCAEGWRSEQSATWAIVSRARDNVSGRVTIYTSLEDGHGEVSYWVLPSARGHGVATRACVAATEWAHRLGIHRVQLQHSTQNESSSIGRHTAIGGRDALADDVLSSASSLGMTTERISGATRFRNGHRHRRGPRVHRGRPGGARDRDRGTSRTRRGLRASCPRHSSPRIRPPFDVEIQRRRLLEVRGGTKSSFVKPVDRKPAECLGFRSGRRTLSGSRGRRGAHLRTPPGSPRGEI